MSGECLPLAELPKPPDPQGGSQPLHRQSQHDICEAIESHALLLRCQVSGNFVTACRRVSVAELSSTSE